MSIIWVKIVISLSSHITGLYHSRRSSTAQHTKITLFSTRIRTLSLQVQAAITPKIWIAPARQRDSRDTARTGKAYPRDSVTGITDHGACSHSSPPTPWIKSNIFVLGATSPTLFPVGNNAKVLLTVRQAFYQKYLCGSGSSAPLWCRLCNLGRQGSG